MDPVEGFRPVAINIGVRDMQEAIEFYEASFGAKLETTESGGRPVHARWQFGAGDSFFFSTSASGGRRNPIAST